MSIVFNSKKYTVEGLNTKSWLDMPNIKYITDKTKRTRGIRMIVVHTHEGILSNLVQSDGRDSTIDETLARYQTNTERQVSWDYTVDLNGDVLVQNDPFIDYSWQAGNVNGFSLGIEMVQDKDPSSETKRILYSKEIEKTVLLIDTLTAALGIQRQIPWNKKTNKPNLKPIKRLSSEEGSGDDLVGIIGHSNVTNQRGPGDPGEHIFYALKAAGYECFDMDNSEDILIWRQRQKELGVAEKDCDGIPLAKTAALLKSKGYKNGIFIQRPIDSILQF